jgi:hypothetical protein
VSIEWTLLALRLLAVAVLYSFLIIVVYVIWRDLGTAPLAQDQGPDVSALVDGVVVSAGRLLVVSGGESDLRTGDVFDLRAHTSLGRATDNDFVLLDTYVSSYHARLDRRDGEWWLTDLASRNGTHLNGVPITKSVPLAGGDVIGIGQVELKLEIED